MSLQHPIPILAPTKKREGSVDRADGRTLSVLHHSLRAQRTTCWTVSLLVGLVAVVTAGGGLAGGALACDASGSALAVRGCDREVDVLLAVHAHHELGHVDQLLAHAVCTYVCENKQPPKEDGEEKRVVRKGVS